MRLLLDFISSFIEQNPLATMWQLFVHIAVMMGAKIIFPGRRVVMTCFSMICIEMKKWLCYTAIKLMTGAERYNGFFSCLKNKTEKRYSSHVLFFLRKKVTLSFHSINIFIS